MIYLLAYNRTDTMRWVDRQRLQPNDWRFIGESPVALAGLVRPVVVLIGDCRRRRDWNAVYARICAVDAIVIEVEA